MQEKIESEGFADRAVFKQNKEAQENGFETV
jgi:hypothetical protein